MVHAKIIGCRECVAIMLSDPVYYLQLQQQGSLYVVRHARSHVVLIFFLIIQNV